MYRNSLEMQLLGKRQRPDESSYRGKYACKAVYTVYSDGGHAMKYDDKID